MCLCHFQTLADDSLNDKSYAHSIKVVKTRLASCDLSDVGSMFEQLITGGVYTLVDVIITLEGSVYQTVTCAGSGFKGFWSCAHDVWAEEIPSVQETVQDYYSTAQELITDIVQELLTCVNL